MALTNLRSGIFLRPFHPTDEDPTSLIRRDLELVEWLDRRGFEEAWIGEHHSAGYEIISSPNCLSPRPLSARGGSSSAPGSCHCPTTIR